MDTLHLIFLAGLILCELFESYWQQAPTMGGMLERIARIYRSNILLLFMMHPSFYLVIFIFLYYGGHGTLLSIILVMKGADIATKLWMVQKIEKRELASEFQAMLSTPIPHWLPWINVVLYPALLTVALN
ncbi:hypothetical protein [Hydrogenimonas sp.]